MGWQVDVSGRDAYPLFPHVLQADTSSYNWVPSTNFNIAFKCRGGKKLLYYWYCFSSLPLVGAIVIPAGAGSRCFQACGCNPGQFIEMLSLEILLLLPAGTALTRDPGSLILSTWMAFPHSPEVWSTPLTAHVGRVTSGLARQVSASCLCRYGVTRSHTACSLLISTATKKPEPQGCLLRAHVSSRD